MRDIGCILVLLGGLVTGADFGTLADRRKRCRGFLPEPQCFCSTTDITCVNIPDPDHEGELFMQITDERFPNVETLRITGSKFPTLHGHLFGLEGTLPKLRKLDLSNNSITQIHGEAFVGVAHLQELNLSNNNITLRAEHDPNEIVASDDPRINDMPLFSGLDKLRRLYLSSTLNKVYTQRNTSSRRRHVASQIELLDKVFNESSSLAKLEHLSLDENEIVSLPRRFLCHFRNLTSLSLRGNALKTFSPALECLQQVQVLRLDGNGMHYVTAQMMNVLSMAPNLRSVNLSGNPFQCDCYQKSFIMWLREDKRSDRVVHKKELMCTNSGPLFGVFLTQVAVEKLRCPDDGGSYIHGIYIIVGLVLVGLVLLPVCLLYSNRSRLVKFAHFFTARRGAFGGATTTVGYSRLQRQPDSQPELV